MAVPKKEIDKADAAYRRKRARKKRGPLAALNRQPNSARAFLGVRRVKYNCLTNQWRTGLVLFANAEPAEDAVKQVVGVNCADHLAKLV